MFFIQLIIFFMLAACFLLLFATFKKSAFAVFLWVMLAALTAALVLSGDFSDPVLWMLLLFEVIPVVETARRIRNRRGVE
ncbi:hypothetical protein [Bacillus swezeyi]|uniref:Uncharacterized protein n=1 Tax=Bacillus swezeyi TaxID=1925020 RepID=A0A5M8RXF6_9BACI|nr:hypothetical protein [Bacillus swezeyi]KAA6450492.1 hypothetical protein DX927_06360 [Bacillus swezeyi]TYS37029.1 hypothetical protein FZC77_06210 [Bacillus swezeyi]